MGGNTSLVKTELSYIDRVERNYFSDKKIKKDKKRKPGVHRASDYIV